MKKIILANIGNRNISYQDEHYDRKLHGLSFREWTKQLVDSYENVSADLSENIITRLLDPIDNQPGVAVGDVHKLILFATNQLNETKQDQDTLYEAELIKRLFEQQYGFPVEIQQLQCRVTDNDALLRTYRNKLSALLVNSTNEQFIICDAGGTAQLKFNLKIIAEYLLPTERFEVLYVNISGPVERVPQKEYRRVIDDEQVRSLVAAGQYRAALLLRGFARPTDALTSSAVVDRLLLFAYARFNRLDGLISGVAQEFGKEITQYPMVLAVNQQSVAIGTERFTDVLSEQSKYALGELLLKVRCLFDQQRYNETMLTLAVFYETYLAAVITHQFGYDLVAKNHSERKRLLKDWPIFFPEMSMPIGLDVPLQIDLCSQVSNPDNQQFLTLLNQHISRGAGDTSKASLNGIRNKVAHNGYYVSDADLTSKLSYLPALLTDFYRLLDLPTDDPYHQLNKMIADEL